MIDIRKMERPHRSGVLAVAIAYALMYVAIDFTNIGNTGEGTFKDLLLCHALPMLCINLHETRAVPPPPPPPPQYETTKLIFCPTCKVKRQNTNCEWENDKGFWVRDVTIFGPPYDNSEIVHGFEHQPRLPVDRYYLRCNRIPIAQAQVFNWADSSGRGGTGYFFNFSDGEMKLGTYFVEQTH